MDHKRIAKRKTQKRKIRNNYLISAGMGPYLDQISQPDSSAKGHNIEEIELEFDPRPQSVVVQNGSIGITQAISEDNHLQDDVMNQSPIDQSMQYIGPCMSHSGRQMPAKSIDSESIEGGRKKVGMSFNAGGIRGYLSALVIRQMEQDMGMPINQFVDVFSGVSIGCILSSLYALGVSSDAVVNLFETQSGAIFKPKFYYKWGIFPIKGPRYCSDSLFQTLHTLVGDKQLKDVNRVLIGLGTDMTDSLFPQCTVFSNTDDQFAEVRVIDMMMASSAAPSYFAQYTVNSRIYVDGGLSSCDSSIQCVSGLQSISENVLKDSLLINMGTGIYPSNNTEPDHKCTWNTFYLTHGLQTSITANQSLQHQTAAQLYAQSNDFFYLDAFLDHNIALDEISAIPSLKTAALAIIESEEYKRTIMRLKENQSRTAEPISS